jgi:oligoribonuclease NrnB/cAMP/cGMP phosphodiesterase (DHH superfamily)
MDKVSLKDFLGDQLEEDFLEFDLTNIQEVLEALAEESAHDLAHAEFLQQKALRGADILSEYLCKIVKTVSYLETKINSTKNKVSLEYMAPEGRTTSEMKKWAGESSPIVEELQIRLAKAKASKMVLEKKYDILIKSHHHFKDIASGIRKTILGYNSGTTEKVPDGYE